MEKPDNVFNVSLFILFVYATCRWSYILLHKYCVSAGFTICQLGTTDHFPEFPFLCTSGWATQGIFPQDLKDRSDAPDT